MPNPDNCATFFFMTSLFFPFFLILTLSGLPITPELGYCRHSDNRARSLDGGERVKSYAGKTRGDTRGHWGEKFSLLQPPLVCVASVSGSIFARSLTLIMDNSIPRSLHGNRTERLASQARSPLVFFFLVNFSLALFNLNAWNHRSPKRNMRVCMRKIEFETQMK